MRSISISEFKRFLNCRLCWYWSSAPPRGLGLRPKVDLPELSFGRLIHAALQRGYDDKVPFADAYLEVVEDEDEPADTLLFQKAREKHLEQVEMGYQMLQGYQGWAQKQDRKYTFLATESKWDSVPIPGTDATFSAVIDAVVEDEDGLWIMDFKTTGNSYTGWTEQDPQATAYVYAARQLISPDIKGMIYRFLKKSVPTDYNKLILKNGQVTTRKSVPTETTLEAYLKALAIAVLQDLDQKGEIDYQEDRTLDGYNSALGKYWDLEQFQFSFKMAQRLYRDQLESLQYSQEFFWDKVEHRSEVQVKYFLKHFLTPVAEEIKNVKWIGPTGLASAWSQCSRCAFKVPCKLAMSGANYKMILEDEFEVSPHYLEEESDEDS